jgi:DNA-binding LacI/PurR family transcriptional regulator
MTKTIIGRKVDKVGAELIQLIQQKDWRQGVKLPSTKELAKQFNASYVTVCRSLHKLQQDGWVKRQNGVGTFVDGTVYENHKIKKIAIPLRVENNPFFLACYEELSLACSKHGIEVILGDGLHEAEFIDKLSSNNSHLAIIRFPAGPNQEAILRKKLKKSQIKTVIVNDWWFGGKDFSSVLTNESSALETLLDNLLKNGHKHIALLDDTYTSKRIKAHETFIKWHWKQNFKLDSQQFIYFWEDDFHAHLDSLLSHGITAVISMFDLLTIRTMKYLSSVNIKVPEQLSFVSFDGTKQIQDKNITSMQQNIKALVDNAIRMVLSDDSDTPESITIESELFEGKTVKNLKHKYSSKEFQKQAH